MALSWKYTYDELMEDSKTGADVLFYFRGVDYGLFIWWCDEQDNLPRRQEFFIGPCGKHETMKYASLQDMLDNYKLDGIPFVDAIPEMEVFHHS